MKIPAGQIETIRNAIEILIKQPLNQPLESIATADLAASASDMDQLVTAPGKVMERISDAISSIIRQDLDKSNPGRPWRILLLNRAIVATRSHVPDTMEKAFEVLTNNLPEEAAQFFNAGMQQMDALNYPQHVREVMEKHHNNWSRKHSLH